MKIIIELKIEKPDIDMIYVDQKTNVENFTGTDEELVLLDKIVKAIKEEIVKLQDNY